MKMKVNKVVIQITQEELLKLSLVVIVNQTDTSLTIPPTLAAIAGSELVQECAAIGWCDVGSAVITSAARLPYDRIIHVVGPRWGEGSERGKLVSATYECLRLAEFHHLKSLGIPAISTGLLGYPLENCAKTMLTQIIDYTFEDLKYLRNIVISLDNAAAYEAFRAEFQSQIEVMRASGEGKIAKV